jgi:hypothetical protein
MSEVKWNGRDNRVSQLMDGERRAERDDKIEKRIYFCSQVTNEEKISKVDIHKFILIDL